MDARKILAANIGELLILNAELTAQVQTLTAQLAEKEKAANEGAPSANGAHADGVAAH